ncbi:unnamed protein product [Phaedon cochleariae]|uniref:CCAAT/enhancer-binding protein zeta n=1 Tax=Phaedon cochleariae TaxID=80249 RepID=A0A9N9X4E3_PHACE|nr:unnamed protein product [Phaedon cochleariae]
MKMKGDSRDKPQKKNSKVDIDDDFLEYEEPKKWFDEIQEDPKTFEKCTEQVLIDLKDEAKKCHDSETANYNLKNSKTNRDYQWMKTVMTKGTVSDKIAAHTVLIQENPICNLETIRNMIGMVKVGKKKECVKVMETLTELFTNDLLRPGKRLSPFHQRPLSLLTELSSGNAVSRRKLLAAWYFEDQLKEAYATFVLALNAVAQDTVDSNKEKAVTAMYKLLAGNPEQEKNLLKYVVNKLGDPSQKVASKVMYCLTQLLFQHANMQQVVLGEIERLMFRANVASRAQYYSLCFLSQYQLSHEAADVARKLVDVYFSFFKACVKTGDVDSRMMSALLTGINRAYPYAKMEYDQVSQHIDTIYRLVHLANFNIGLHALTILYQVSVTASNKIADRFYGALYRKLFDPSLLTTTHRAMLLSLIYKALLKDKEIDRVKMFVKRLLQISLFTQPCFSCGILFLVSQLMGKREHLQALILSESDKKYAGIDADELKDENLEIKEEILEDPITQDSSSPSQILSDPIEIKEEEEDVKPDVDLLDAAIKAEKNLKKEKGPVEAYNPWARNPLYGGGKYAAYVELYDLANHFHPTVALFARNIVRGETIKYAGDPLNDFTLIRFLDRFVFKNPRKIEETAGKNPMFAKRKLYRAKGVKSLSVKSAGYAKENPDNIPVDELFVHMYLQEKYREKAERDEEADSDLESVQSEEFEEMLDKMAGVRDDEEDIDYMREIGDTLRKSDEKKKKSKGKREDEDGSISENEEMDEELSDFDQDNDDDELLDEDDDDGMDEMDEDDKELLADLSSDDDEEDIEFMEDDEEEVERNKKKMKKLRKGGNKDDIMSQFAAADEFAALLEEEGSSRVKSGTSSAFLNRDNADVKQLAWEDDRNKWLRGFDRAVGGGHRKRKAVGDRKKGKNSFKRKK